MNSIRITVTLTQGDTLLLLKALKAQATLHRANSRNAKEKAQKVQKGYNATGFSHSLTQAQEYRRQSREHAKSADALNTLRALISRQAYPNRRRIISAD